MSPAAIAALAAALAYLPSLAGAFQFDDYNVIIGDPAVHSWGALAADAGTGIRPLLKASYALSWTMGLGAVGFHLFNIAVHALNAALVVLVGRALCGRWLGADAPRADAAVLAAALLFALHPAQTEAVTYISGRSGSLMASFYLGALLAYLRGSRWSAVLFVCALATKETAVTLPFVLLLVDRGFTRKQLAHWGVLLAALAVLLLHERYFQLLTFGFSRREFFDNLPTQVGGVSYLVLRLVGLQGTNIDPALPVLDEWSPGLLFQAVLFLLLFILGAMDLRRRPWLGFGLLWFFLQLAPTNSLVPRLDVANDRQLYLACWGLFLAASVQVALAAPPRRVAATAALLALLLAGASVLRQWDYRSEIALWEADAAKAPWNARARNNLGYAYQQAGRFEDARREYQAALALDPGHAKARFNLMTIGASR